MVLFWLSNILSKKITPGKNLHLQGAKYEQQIQVTDTDCNCRALAGMCKVRKFGFI